MSNHLDFTRGRAALIGIAACLAFAAIPIGFAQAAPVNPATTKPFVVLSGAGVENTGPSVLNGDLGVSPGTSLVGFGAPATVNGAIHENDGVAAQAQADLTTAYNVASGQAVSPGNELTGQNLGGLTLTPGTYGFSSSAELTGQLTLDAQGDPDAEFVFVIGTTLVTESASSVILTNGASPCNVYWKVGSSATFGTTTAFEGNVLALESISVNNGVTVLGRLLARNGEVTLINDVLTAPQCSVGSGSGGEAGSGTATTTVTPAGTSPVPAAKKKKGTPTTVKAKTGGGTATIVHGPVGAGGVNVGVRGKRIKKVTITVNGARVGGHPRTVRVPTTPGVHHVVAHVVFEGSTKPKTVRYTFRIPTPVLHPRQGPSQFTG
ncbi:MAG TPA: ice-binding family protein [Solirubrobacterales bacterium]|nr:ice-binding family protein [Solirubrobacterales bacterium]